MPRLEPSNQRGDDRDDNDDDENCGFNDFRELDDLPSDPDEIDPWNDWELIDNDDALDSDLADDWWDDDFEGDCD